MANLTDTDLIPVGRGAATFKATFKEIKNSVPHASDATTSAKGVVQLADAAAITAGTAGRVVDAAQLKAATPDATEAAKGVVELATAAETTTGTDATRAVHPAGLKVELDKKVNKAGDTMAGDLTVPNLIATGSVRGAVSVSALSGGVAATGTSVDFTGIPSWAKKITLLFSDVSLSGAHQVIVQVATGGAYLTTGYAGTSGNVPNAGATVAIAQTNGFGIDSALNPAAKRCGTAWLNRFGPNAWAWSAVTAQTGNAVIGISAGRVEVSAPVDKVRVTTTGASTFTFGHIQLFYEG